MFNSPHIDNYNLYSSYAKERGKESGESIEILLFGRKVEELTLKEALFVLKQNKYIHGKNYFLKKFNICNNMKIEDIISKQTIQAFLILLGIELL